MSSPVMRYGCSLDILILLVERAGEVVSKTDLGAPEPCLLRSQQKEFVAWPVQMSVLLAEFLFADSGSGRRWNSGCRGERWPPPIGTAFRQTRSEIMTDPRYAVFKALDPFFNIVQEGLAGLVDGDHYFDTIADHAVFEFRYIFPGWPQRIEGREALMTLYAGYGDNIVLHGADTLITNRSQDPRIVIIEYEVHGKIVKTGAAYDNRFISVVTIEDRKIVHWRDYMDSLTAMTALSALG